MSAIARTLGVSRSNLIERTNKSSKPRGSYRKPDDIVLLAELRPIIDQRPTYGYRRVTALLNRPRRRDGLPTVHAKRVLRVMQQNGLTLQKHTALRPTRTHDGVVVALRSNIRWCSDHLEIRARNGEVVRIVFVIDACDREIIAWSAVANVGICGEMVCDLMIAAVERRFKTLKVPHRLEWLSDNGSAYIARQTAQVAAALGIEVFVGIDVITMVDAKEAPRRHQPFRTRSLATIEAARAAWPMASSQHRLIIRRRMAASSINHRTVDQRVLQRPARSNASPMNS